MLIGVSVICTCLLFSIMVLILYFSKKRVNNIENKTYSVLLIINIFGLILELLCCYFTYTNGQSVFDTMMCIFCNRLFILYLLTWLTAFIFYIFYTTFTSGIKSKKDINYYTKKFFIAFGILYMVMFVLALTLPLYYYHDSDYVYSYGPATNLLVVFAAVIVVFGLYCLYKNRKTITNKQYLPLIVLIGLLLLAVVIRNLNPGIILINSTFAFITVFMYHTIENPDFKIIAELNRNKYIIEKNIQGTSNFMFNLTSEARKYITDIYRISNDALKINEKDYYKKSFNEVLKATKTVESRVNNLIDISAIDIKNIKISNNKYDVKQMIEEIKLQFQNKISKNINFVVNVSQSIPELVYGDKIRLKQVLSSLLNNAINNTNAGFISIEVNDIIKYDVCRLIISIEDSGKGLDLEKVNDILGYNVDNETVQEINADDLDLNLKMIKKVVKMLGGSFLLTSEENKGTKVTISLDQKIASETDASLESQLEDYRTLLGLKKILIVDDDLKELTTLENYCNELNIDNICTMYGNDVLDRIRTGQKFNLIIIDDAMNKMNALDILKALKANENFKTPVVIMLEEKKLSISKHYLADGFSDYIDKTKLDVEIKRIIDKYLN